MNRLYVSGYTLEFPVDGTLYLFNPLSGAFDRLTDTVVQKEWGLLKSSGNCSPGLAEILKNRGYVYEDQREEVALVEKLQRLAERETSQTIRCHVILSYDCNLRCVYCYEEGINREHRVIHDARLKTMLEVIEELARGKQRTQLVLFGGEPLLKQPYHVRCVQRVLEHGTKNRWGIEIVTNGVDLEHYVHLLKEHSISQIQVTLDGPKHIHDIRRPTVDGRGSFEAIVRSVDAALAAQLPIAVRVNADMQNVEYAPELVDFFSARGWLDESRFGAYWGVTFDLQGRHPYCAPAHVMLRRILEIRKRYPQTKRISLEAWEALQFLLYPYLLGEPRLPKFFFCGAHRNEWCFDLYGDVYFCADGVGREEFRVGKYDPELTLDQGRTALWREHNVLRVPSGCSTCHVKLCCGGGCWFRRMCATRSPLAAYCTEQVWPALATTLEYLHRSPEVFVREEFELPRKLSEGRAQG